MLNKTMLLLQVDENSEMEKIFPENNLKSVDLKYPWSANTSNILSKSKP